MDMDDYELQQRDIDLLRSMAIEDWDRQFAAWKDEQEDSDLGDLLRPLPEGHFPILGRWGV